MVKVNRSTGSDFLAQTALATLLYFTAEDTFSQFEKLSPSSYQDGFKRRPARFLCRLPVTGTEERDKACERPAAGSGEGAPRQERAGIR